MFLVFYKKKKRKHFTSDDSSTPNGELLTPEIGTRETNLKRTKVE
jgi:hypothetical protein